MKKSESIAPDDVRICGLVTDASIGVHEWEHRVRQRLEIDITIALDTRAAARDDDVTRTIDYDAVTTLARAIVAERHHNLIESVGDSIAARILASFVLAESVEVCVKKPGAVAGVTHVAVVVRRTRA